MQDTYTENRPRGAMGITLGAVLLLALAQAGMGALGVALDMLLEAPPIQAALGEWSTLYIENDCPFRRAAETVQNALQRGQA